MAITMEINRLYEWNITIKLADGEVEVTTKPMTANDVMRRVIEEYPTAISVVLVTTFPRS